MKEKPINLTSEMEAPPEIDSKELALSIGLTAAEHQKFEDQKALAIEQWGDFFYKSPLPYLGEPYDPRRNKYSAEETIRFFLDLDNLDRLEKGLLFLGNEWNSTLGSKRKQLENLRLKIGNGFITPEGKLIDIRGIPFELDAEDKPLTTPLEVIFPEGIEKDYIVKLRTHPFFTGTGENISSKKRKRVTKNTREIDAFLKRVHEVSGEDIAQLFTGNPAIDFRLLTFIEKGSADRIPQFAQMLKYHFLRELDTALSMAEKLRNNKNYRAVWKEFTLQHQEALSDPQSPARKMYEYILGGVPRNLKSIITPPTQKRPNQAEACQKRTKKCVENQLAAVCPKELARELGVNYPEFKQRQEWALATMDKIIGCVKTLMIKVTEKTEKANFEVLKKMLEESKLLPFFTDRLNDVFATFYYLAYPPNSKKEEVEKLAKLFSAIMTELTDYHKAYQIANPEQTTPILAIPAEATDERFLSSFSESLSTDGEKLYGPLHESKVLEKVSHLLFRELTCCFPVRDHFTKEKFHPLWMFWCQKNQELLSLPGSDTRKAFLYFWDGMANVPNELRQFLAQAPLSTIQVENKKRSNRKKKKEASPLPRSRATTPVLTREIVPFMTPDVSTGSGQPNTFQVENWAQAQEERENIGLFVKAEGGNWEPIKEIGYDGVIILSPEILKACGTTRNKRKLSFRFAPDASASREAYPETSGFMASFSKKNGTQAVKTSTRETSEDTAAVLKKAREAAQALSENRAAQELAENLDEEHLAIALLMHEHNPLAVIVDLQATENRLTFRFSDEVCAEANLPPDFLFRDTIEVSLPSLELNVTASNSELKRELAAFIKKLQKAITTQKKEAQEKSTAEAEIADFEMEKNEIFEQFAKSQRILKRHQGQWDQDFNGTKGYWWNIFWEKSTEPLRNKLIAELQTKFEPAGIHFSILPRNGKKPISEIKFHFLHSGSKRINGVIIPDGEGCRVVLKNEDVPSHWAEEAEKIGMGIFADIVNFTHYHGFPPRLKRVRNQAEKNYAGSAIRQLNNAKGKTIRYDEDGNIERVTRKSGWEHVINPLEQKLEKSVEIVILDSSINISEGYFPPKSASRHFKKDPNESIDSCYAEVRNNLSERNKKYLVLRVISTVLENRKQWNKDKDKNPFNNNAAQIALQALRVFKIDEESLLSGEVKPGEIARKTIYDDKAGISKDFATYLLDEWEVYREEKEEEGGTVYRRIIPVFQPMITIDVDEMLDQEAEKKSVMIQLSAEQAEVIEKTNPGLKIKRTKSSRQSENQPSPPDQPGERLH